MCGNLRGSGPVGSHLAEMVFDLLPVWTAGLKILFRIPLDLWLSVLAALQLVAQGESAAKLLAAFIRKAEEGAIGKLIVEAVILLSASKQADGGKILRAAAQADKVDTDAIALKVKHEFAAKAKAKLPQKVEAKPAAKTTKAA